MKQVNISGIPFRDMREEDMYYVDKSLLIKDILDTNPGGVHVYTRPRRFGKTTNLTMLDAFFNMEYKGNTWFDGLAISEFHEFDPYRNAFPVIRLNLKDTHPDDRNLFMAEMNHAVRESYDDFRQALGSDVVTDCEAAMIDRVLYGKATENDICDSIPTLCNILNGLYGSRVVILIDEFDHPLTHNTDSSKYDHVTFFLKEFFTAALTNDNLQMAYLTGIMPMSDAGLFPNSIDVRFDDITTTASGERFGFTESEIIGLLDHYGCPEKLDEIKTWYGGYRFGDEEVCVPFSVMCCVGEKFRTSNYWTSNSYNTVLEWMIAKVDDSDIDGLTNLISRESTEICINCEIPLERMEALRGDNLYSLSAMTGYLRTVPTGSGTYLASIPNMDVMSAMDRILTDLSTPCTDRLSARLCNSMMVGDIDLMETALSDALGYSRCQILNSRFSHELVFWRLIHPIRMNYDTMTDRPASNGRTDIILTPKTDRYPPIIIELKTTDRIDRLDAAVQDALHQIHDRRYYNGMSGKVILYGIAFCGVVAKVGTETLEL